MESDIGGEDRPLSPHTLGVRHALRSPGAVAWGQDPPVRTAFGIGPGAAAEMPVVAGDDPTRIRSAAAFAKPCGAYPIPAPRGATRRHRLARRPPSGERGAVPDRDRAAAPAPAHPRLRRPAHGPQGLSKHDVIRGLTRFVARDVYHALRSDHAARTAAAAFHAPLAIAAEHHPLAESGIGLYEAGVIHRRGPRRGFDDVEYATVEWVAWFNTQPLMEPLGSVPPAEFEEEFSRTPAAPATAGALNYLGLQRTGSPAGCVIALV